MIHFPIIRRVSVQNYELFKNSSSEGIEHAFARGVHAVVGINGLGKTTFLTMLYRGLVGPFDQSKSDDAGLLGSQHELSNWRNKAYFRDRVSDAAADATVELDVQFGKRTLSIRRRLANLRLDALSLDGVALSTDEETYQSTTMDLAGVASFFDFFAVLRYLVFFLDDRIELIWDRRSQFDMLRILLFDTAAALEASKAYDEAQAKDSQYRNRRAVYNRQQDRLTELEAAAGLAETAEVRALQVAAIQLEARDRDQALEVDRAGDIIDRARLRRERALLDLHEARTELEYEEQAHYHHLFPEIGPTAEYVFLNILNGSGCLVCGTVGSDVADHLRAKLADHRCPVCNTPMHRHEKVTVPADFSRARLRRLKDKVEQLRVAVQTASQDMNDAEEAQEELVGRREQDRVELSDIRARLAEFGFTQVPTDADIENLRISVAEGQRELERLKAEQTSAEARYARVVKVQSKKIDDTVGNIRRRFREYANLVLAERCELHVAVDNRPIGQEGRRFDFPYFEVMMTSGVFDQSLSTRRSSDAVSES